MNDPKQTIVPVRLTEHQEWKLLRRYENLMENRQIPSMLLMLLEMQTAFYAESIPAGNETRQTQYLELMKSLVDLLEIGIE